MVLYCVFSEVSDGGDQIPTGAWRCIRADKQILSGSHRGTVWASPSDWERSGQHEFEHVQVRDRQSLLQKSHHVLSQL